jgi:hypothetical protein
MNFSDLDTQTQQEDLERRKALIDALVAKQAQGTSLGDVVKGFFGGGQNPQAMQAAYSKDRDLFQQRRQDQLSGELDGYMARRQGMPERPPSPDYAGNAVGPTMPAQAANPREAIIRAMTSQLSEMQAIGKADFGSLGKAPERKEHVINGQLVESTGGQTRVLGNFGETWKDEARVIEGRQVEGKRNAQTNEWKPVGASGQTINIGADGQKELIKEVLPVIKGARDSVMKAQQGLDASQRVLAALSDPQVQTGFGASAVTGVAALGAKLGFNGPDGVAKTQALASDLARNTLAAGQDMKGSFSDKDIAFLTDVTLGKVDFTKEALQDLAALAYQANHNSVLNAMDQYKSAAQFKGMEGAAGLYPLPPVSWDARISDNPAFQKDSTGRLRYTSSYSQAQKAAPPQGRVNSQGRKRYTLDEFMAIPQPGEQQ